jgi:hypothetical protein
MFVSLILGGWNSVIYLRPDRYPRFAGPPTAPANF